MVAVAARPPRPVVLDVDTGVDDALALLYALAHPGLDVRAVTGVCGNVSLDRVMINTAVVLAAAGADGVPIAAGAAASLTGRGPRTGSRHGADGLGDLRLPAVTGPPGTEGATALLRRQITGSTEPVTLVALAPQTNLALLLRAHPPLAARVREVAFMGGRLGAEAAEFNLAHDPEAAAEVLAAAWPLTMYPYDLFDQIRVSDTERRRLAGSPAAGARLAAELIKLSPGGRIGDAGVLILLTSPELFDTEQLPITIGLHGAAQGRTLPDPAGRALRVAVGVRGEDAARAYVEILDPR